VRQGRSRVAQGQEDAHGTLKAVHAAGGLATVGQREPEAVED